MADYDVVPVEGNPFDNSTGSSYNVVPVQGNPFNQPSFLSNTWTGIARGLGGLLDKSGQAELIEQQAPSEVTPKPGEIAQSATNTFTGGQPYQPTTDLGRAYQNIIANTTEAAPLAAIGPGGLTGLLGRGLATVGSTTGGELGERMMPDHPIIGRIGGGILGGMVGGGLAPSIKPPAIPSVSDAEQILTQQGGFFTPARIASMSDLNKQQAAAKIIGAGPEVPGLFSRITNTAGNLYNKLPLAKENRFIAPLLAGEGVLNYPDKILQGLQFMYHNPLLGSAALAYPALRGAMINPAQTAQGTIAGLLSGSSGDEYTKAGF